MTDTRPRVPLNGKTVNLEQLAREVGTALCASDTEVCVADPASTVTKTRLQAAVTAHVALPLPDPNAAFITAVAAATTLADLKAALTGKDAPWVPTTTATPTT